MSWKRSNLFGPLAMWGCLSLFPGLAWGTLGLLGRCDFGINQVRQPPEDIQFYSDWPEPPSWITYQGEPISSHEASRHFWLFIQLGPEGVDEALAMALDLRWNLEAVLSPAADPEENELRVLRIEDGLKNFSQDVQAKGRYLELLVVYQTQVPNPNPLADFRMAYPDAIYFYLLVIYNHQLCEATDIIWSDFTVPTFLSSFLARPGPGQVVLEWMTEGERDNLGFNLLRRSQGDAAFQIINERLIPVVSDRPAQAQQQYSHIDRDVQAGVTYEYRLEDVDLQGQRSICGMASATPAQAGATLPEGFRLFQNYPNPFNASTEIRYRIPARTHVLLRVFDVRGELIEILVDEDQEGGEHALLWDGRTGQSRSVSSGLYFCSLQAFGHQEVMKMVLLR